jgi:signal-transduction protein with cAMP-binding, CBS, and nucleotidyltransferase domain
MAQKIKDIMTASPITLTADRPVTDAATAMKENGIGDVIVMTDGKMCGLVTDRDIVVRVIAQGREPQTTKLGDVCSRDIESVGPDDDVDRVIDLVRKRSIRRVPVVDSGKPVGIVSIGDLAMERDQKSALADVSAAAPNR